MIDPISDMLNRIRNAQASGLEKIEMPFSNLKYAIAEVMEKNKLVGKIEKKGKKTKKTLEMALKYEDKIPLISGLKRISKPGRRIYTDYRQIRRVRNGYGIAIISTPKGILTDREARRNKIGGEIICEIW
jgi:small subunit ribosomal protein S8